MSSTANRPERAGLSVGLLAPLLAGGSTSNEEAVLDAALKVEVALSEALVNQGLANSAELEAVRKAAAVENYSVSELALGASRGGNFIIPLVEQLKKHAEAQQQGSSWMVHPGATSQDILDSALMLVAKTVAVTVDGALAEVQQSLSELAIAHQDQVCAARTLTQHSVPYTWGLRFAMWLNTVTDAREQLAGWVTSAPLQWGGASGTNAALVARFGLEAAAAIPQHTAQILGLSCPALPWHSNRTPIIQLGNALAAVNISLGTIANNVAMMSRPEIAELSETIGEGQGGSSAMPQKRNPIRSIMIRTAVSPVPGLVAELTRLGMTIDERSDGAWQAEWPVVQQLLAITEAVANEAGQLVAGLQVNAEQASLHPPAQGTALLAERVMQELGPQIGAERAKKIIAGMTPPPLPKTEVVLGTTHLPELLQQYAAEVLPTEQEQVQFSSPHHYLGQYREFIDAAVERARANQHPPEEEA